MKKLNKVRKNNKKKKKSKVKRRKKRRKKRKKKRKVKKSHQRHRTNQKKLSSKNQTSKRPKQLPNQRRSQCKRRRLSRRGTVIRCVNWWNRRKINTTSWSTYKSKTQLLAKRIHRRKLPLRKKIKLHSQTKIRSKSKTWHRRVISPNMPATFRSTLYSFLRSKTWIISGWNPRIRARGQHMMTLRVCVSSGTIGNTCKEVPTRRSIVLCNLCQIWSLMLNVYAKWMSTLMRRVTIVNDVVMLT